MTGAAALLAVALVSPAPPAEDPRGVELLRYGCTSEIARRELTLHANGTLRLREAEGAEPSRMRLAELGQVELAAYLARLGEVELAEVEAAGPEAGGEWIEECTLTLSLADRPERSFHFGRMDSLPLGLGRLLRVVDDLLVEVEERTPRSRLPFDYEPRPGDTLRRIDGTVFEVLAFTGDGAGLELESADGSLVLFIPVAALRDEFEELVGRRP